MADINKFTTKEVLNKVLLDSSGNSVAANSHTSQEALNAVLDTSNNRLNVSLGGSNTISGDVTITGDLTVQGSGGAVYDEIIEGSLHIKTASSGQSTADTAADELVVENNDSGGISILTPDNSLGQLAFGSASDAYGAFIGWKHDDNQMTIATANAGDSMVLQTANKVTAVTINSSQNVGIGCDHPSVPLEVELSGDTGTYFEGGGSGNDASDLRHLTITASTTTSAGDTHTLNAESGSGVLKFATSGSDRMIVNSTGVGIGISPSVPLHISKATDGGLTEIFINNSASGGSTDETVGIRFTHNQATAAGILAGRTEDFSNSANRSGHLIFKTNHNDSYAERMRIASDGNVSIGSTNPVAKLVVSDGGNAGIELQPEIATDTNRITNFDRTASTYMNFRLDALTQQFLISGTEKMRLTSTGLGIGNDSPSANLHILNSSGAGHLILETTSASHGVTLDLRGSADRDAEIIFREGSSAKAMIFNDASNNSLSLTDGSGGLSPVLNIKSSSVSIGTTDSAASSGAENLIVGSGSGSEGMTIYSGTGDFGSIHFSDSSSSDTGQYKGIIRYGHGGSGEQMEVFANANKRMVIDDNSRISLSNNDGGGTGGDSSTTGNTLFGYSIGDMDTNSINNTLIGHKVAGGGTHADMRSNVGVGTLALYAITEGDNNIAIGKESADAITTGSANVAIGTSSLGASTTTHNNVAVGTSVLQSLNTSSQNTALGSSAMSSIGTGASGLNNCVAIGYQAFQGGTNTTSGPAGTVAIGMNSLTALTTGAGNTAIGYTAGADVTTAFNNTLIGYNAGNTGTVDLLDGNSNTYIGFESRGSSASAINQTVIGKGAHGQGNNSVTLGNTDVTAVYMAQDSCATVHCAGVVVSEGINFPDDASANPSSDANTLDNYEEGTFTPTLTTNSTDFTSVTYDAETSGRYTKVGNIVHVQGFIRTDAVSIGSASGDVCIGGLPFTAITSSAPTSKNHAAVSLSLAIGWSGENPSHGLIIGGGTLIQLYYADYNVDPNNVAVSDVTGGTVANQNQVYFAGTYIV